MKITKIPKGVRFHYWTYQPGCPCKACTAAGLNISKLERKVYIKIKPNLLVQAIISKLDHELKIKWPNIRYIVVAECRYDPPIPDLPSVFAIAVLHPKDEKDNRYNKILGREIALGRLLKHHPELKEAVP